MKAFPFLWMDTGLPLIPPSGAGFGEFFVYPGYPLPVIGSLDRPFDMKLFEYGFPFSL